MALRDGGCAEARPWVSVAGLLLCLHCGALTAPADEFEELVAKVVATFEEGDAVAMTVSYSEGEKESAARIVTLDVLMAKGGKFRVRASQGKQELAEIACDGAQIVEWDRRSGRWTRYPLSERAAGSTASRLWVDQAGEVFIGFALSRFASSWVTKPSDYEWFFQQLRLADERRVGREAVSGRACNVITAKQIKKNGPFTAECVARCAYDAHTHLPVLEETSTQVKVPPYSSRRRFAYDKVELNPAVAADAFMLQPPRDTEFVDPADLRPGVPSLVGQAVDSWEVKSVEGSSMPLMDPKHRGPLVVVTWATWCLPCRAELACLAKLQDTAEFKGVAILAVSVDRDQKKLASFLRRHPQPFRVAWEPEFLDRLSAPGVPTTLVIDREGVVRAMWTGWSDDERDPVNADKLRRAVREAEQ